MSKQKRKPDGDQEQPRADKFTDTGWGHMEVIFPEDKSPPADKDDDADGDAED